MSTLDAVVLAYQVRWFLGGLLLPLPTLAVLGILSRGERG